MTSLIATVEEFGAEPDPLLYEHTRQRATEFLDGRTPRRFAAASVTVPEVREWVRQLIAAAARTRFVRVEHGDSLLLQGTKGTGKTWQAYGALRALATSGALCQWRFETAPNLFGALRPRSGFDAEQVYEGYRDIPLLILDDLGAQRDTEFTGEYLHRLIDHRWSHELPMLITSNLLSEEFAERFGDRITSRLAQMCTRALLRGPDRRRSA